MSVRTVYSWATEATAEWLHDGELAPNSSTAPAIRVWGDVIIQLIAERRDRTPQPPLAVRRDAVFAWTQRTPLPALVGQPGRVQLEIDVEETACAAARSDLVTPLFEPPSWRELRLWLEQHGHAPDMADEEIVTITAPQTPMQVAVGPEAVRSTDATLLADVLSYFEPDVIRYIDSWHRLDRWAPTDNGSWEVVVPSAAVRQVRLAA